MLDPERGDGEDVREARRRSALPGALDDVIALGAVQRDGSRADSPRMHIGSTSMLAAWTSQVPICLCSIVPGDRPWAQVGPGEPEPRSPPPSSAEPGLPESTLGGSPDGPRCTTSCEPSIARRRKLSGRPTRGCFRFVSGKRSDMCAGDAVTAAGTISSKATAPRGAARASCAKKHFGCPGRPRCARLLLSRQAEPAALAEEGWSSASVARRSACVPACSYGSSMTR